MGKSLDSFSYLVGAIDNGGLFYISQVEKSDRRSGLIWYYGFELYSFREEIIQLLLKEFGGSQINRIKKMEKTYMYHRWYIGGTQLRKFCIKICPYLINQKEMCLLIIRFLDTYSAFRTTRLLDQDTIEERKRIAAEYKDIALNRFTTRLKRH